MPSRHLIFAPHYKPQWVYAFVISLSLTITTACGQASGPNYFPLAAGARWEYAGHFSSSHGGEYNIRLTMRVDGETLINGKRYFKLITTGDASSLPTVGRQIEDVRYYRFAEDGIYFRSGNDPTKPDVLELPLPIPIGVKWLSGTSEMQAERAGTLEIGNSEYRDCLKVTSKPADGVHTVTNYYAPGVGIVKLVYTNTTPPQSTAELTLVSYHL